MQIGYTGKDYSPELYPKCKVVENSARRSSRVGKQVEE